MHNNMSRCIDINSAYCPCLLAETNNCVFCSHLQGKFMCDCNWAGVCVLYEKYWQPKKRCLRGGDVLSVRVEAETQYEIIERINEHVYRLEFVLPNELAESLTKAGAFIFMRCPGDPDFYYFPVGIMKVNQNKVQVVIEAIGPKSRRILSETCSKIMVRGPYFNGILGQPWIDNTENSRILLVAGGMGQPPALAIASKLVNNNNEVTAVLAPGHIGKVFIGDELRALGIQVKDVTSMRRDGLDMLTNIFSEYDLVVSAGPDEQHYGVIDAMQRADINLPMAATNNATMCCGEGICGSCQKETQRSGVIRTCKVQTDFKDIIRD
ncbi:MAG: hypothetical protein GX348_02790 [Veillonellaceae bacterium]|jgi:dihydroorotate dehydrogenase electron transfer subunit|nr:hypothetical protein [Veillonellaceae bacterium]